MAALNNKKLTGNVWVKKKDILFANFIGGVAWGLGSVIGATIFVAIIVWILNLLGIFDFVKDYFPRSSYSGIRLFHGS